MPDRGRGSRDLLLAAAFVGAVAGAGRLSVDVPGSPVPVSAQSFAALAGAMAIGPTPAVVGALTYGALSTAGVEPFAPTRRATRGYVAGLLFTAPVVALAAERARTARQVAMLAAVGHGAVLASGAVWLRLGERMSTGQVWQQGVRPFLPGAVVKTVAAAAAVTTARRLVSRRGSPW